MTSPNDRPRHLDPKTAQMPALPRVPRHAHYTGQQRAVQPWEQPGGLVDRPAFVEQPGTDEQPFWRPAPGVPTGHPEFEPEILLELESRDGPNPPRIQPVGWWARFRRWLNGGEVWK